MKGTKMAEIKLGDLPWGTLNWIQESDRGLSGDRRRTSPVTSLRLAVESAYAKDALNNVTEFNGVVVSYREVSYASYKNKTALLEKYLICLNSETDEVVERSLGTSAQGVSPVYAYKVYIPELEPRPAPRGAWDPVLLTYPDVYSDIDSKTPLSLGDLVAIKYENVDNLFNPRIVRKVGGPIQIESSTPAELSKTFKEGVPATLGNDDDVAITGDAERPAGFGGAHVTRPWALSVAGLEHLALAEGYRENPYNDSQGHCTVGIGTLLHFGACTGEEASMTRQEAMAALNEHVAGDLAVISEGVTVPLTQPQIDSLVSFVYNVGRGAFSNSTLLRVLNRGDYAGAALQFDRWHIPVEIIGRRDSERELFSSGILS
jgi:lysozyme